MVKYLIPIILIVISTMGFLTFTRPLVSDISNMKNEIVSYNEALDNSKSLENERDKLTKKYNTIDTNNLTKLQKFLPDSIDNIRLILEIEKLASPYGMILKDIKYDSKKEVAVATNTTETTGANAGNQDEATVLANSKDYGIWDLEFSTEGKYSSFLNFMKDLEGNLRIVDISSVVFSSEDNQLGKKQAPDSYKYTIKIKTYWLKN